ncbi:CaiB/BaiF CoA transferase family protein [Bacillus pseudomycoides]|uniref:CaiB/BaiF CoA transferase family protein n=1 Tax=Bacillus pseudomycoides TaxID=64104 RepID=UPI000BEC6230|nr:CaiB/BaiF CoA-transferase family protein [Bacillus pseudomycoides]PEA83931.1 CoA transferase [Bacillus pseudomycoides]PED08918.1 CoA transferase [Bacillus pseudomycoides]PEI94595.1 CoA transferase [Bacillus pseudomycoides]PEK28334.1 CoA transferase [Bacillus pseudomycoides]PEM75773.1 CoA transferase [Bacillus pseudomycoides]
MEGALHGIKIIDLSRVLAGPFCTMILGDLGAEVIKVENIGNGDDTRGWGPPFVEGESAYFLCANRNKESLTINLKSEMGKDILKKLVSHADIVVQNFKPGTLERMGLGYDVLQEVKGDIILASISGFGQKGPASHLPGYDYMIQAMSGLMSITGGKDEEPAKVGVAISDVLTGLFTCIGILAALQHRNRTGEGQEIDISLFDSQLAALVNVASNYLCTGELPERLGNQHPNIVPYQVFKAKDGDLVVAVGNDEQFHRFCVLLGRQDLSRLDRYTTNASRLLYKEELIDIIAKEMKKKKKEEWKQLLDEAGIPNGPILNVKEALETEQAGAREMTVHMEHPTIENLKLVGSPLKLAKTPVRMQKHPPLHGEHTKQILKNLGYSQESIREMKKNQWI